jgi:hypothetical protein
MSATDLPKQIARMQQSIARLEAKAARCNAGSELGRAVATRAEKSATHYRKHLEKLRHQMQAQGPADLHPNDTASATTAITACTVTPEHGADVTSVRSPPA